MSEHPWTERNWDVIVCGGGPGGVNAAVAAAKQGAKVLLVERYGYLGGMATAGLVNPFMPYTVSTTGQVLTTSVFNELLDRLQAAGGLAPDRAVFDDEQMKLVLDQMLADHGVSVLFHAFVTGVEVSAGAIQSVRITGKSGEMRLRAKVFVDSTGDGDVAALAGCEVQIGRSQDGLCQPMTLCFRLGGVEADTQTFAGIHRLSEQIDPVYKAAKVRGEIGNPREDVLIFPTVRPGVLHFNTTRVIQHSALDTLSLSDAEQLGRKQVIEMIAFLQANFPAFQNAYLQKMAAHIGVRESRRVIGMYVLTADELLAGTKFEDGIARSVYPVDIHNPSGTGTVLQRLPEGEFYEIPYLCLVPRGPDNLLIGSRCISSTHEAHSSLRVIPVVAGIGEAAGIAAAWSAQRELPVSELDGREIRTALLIG